jgi:zinc protease
MLKGRLLLMAIPLLGLSCASLTRRSAGGGAAGARTPGGGGGGGADSAVEVSSAAIGSLTATKWRLTNGLEVILMPDPAATSVSYMTWFRVGSRNEDEAAGETGLAHLFEHLMFAQTKSHAVGEFDRSMEAVGGTTNAMTDFDFTAYVDNLPPAELPLAIRLEADRMVNLRLRKREVETERDVVIEERLAAVEDSVDGLLHEVMYKQAFKTHPYRWPVIGWMKDIKAVTDKKALAFYSKFYAPNNAVVVIAGKIAERAALDAIVAAYGGLSPTKNLPADEIKPERAPAKEVRTEVTRPVPADRFVTGYPAVALADPDRAAYELVDEILTGGPSSRLHRALVVDKEIASSVDGDVASTKDPGLYSIWVQMTKGHAAEEAEAVILSEVASLAAKPPSSAELEKAKNRLETALWRGMSSSHGRAELLGQFEIACGDFRRLPARADEYRRTTADDVRRVVTDYLAAGARSVVVARPKPARGPEEGSGPR